MSAGAKQPVYRLRKSRRQETKRFEPRGNPADRKPNSLSLAEVPQTGNQIVWASRKSRRQETKWFEPRGSPANEKLNGLGFAEVPQTRNQTVLALQQYCRQETKQFLGLATLGTAFAIEKEII